MRQKCGRSGTSSSIFSCSLTSWWDLCDDICIARSRYSSKFSSVIDKSVIKSNNSFMVIVDTPFLKTSKIQDCIPVGCIPLACWPYLPACTAQGGCLIRGCLLGGVVSQHALRQTPLWTEWQTGAKILPWPKLRLRAVTTKPLRQFKQKHLVGSPPVTGHG